MKTIAYTFNFLVRYKIESMKKYITFVLIGFIMIFQSCDPGGMSFVRNNSADTLKLQLIGNYSNKNVTIDNNYCKSFYDNIYFVNKIVPNKKLDDWYDIMHERPSIMKGSSILEIVVPPKSTIITNNGLAASRLFRSCASDYVVFTLAANSDTLFNIANFDNKELMEFYNRNDIKLTTKSRLYSTVNILDIYGIE
jgi:hypothetical protein